MIAGEQTYWRFQGSLRTQRVCRRAPSRLFHYQNFSQSQVVSVFPPPTFAFPTPPTSVFRALARLALLSSAWLPSLLLFSPAFWRPFLPFGFPPRGFSPLPPLSFSFPLLRTFFFNRSSKFLLMSFSYFSLNSWRVKAPSFLNVDWYSM